jgi:hypothetical protein
LLAALVRKFVPDGTAAGAPPVPSRKAESDGAGAALPWPGRVRDLRAAAARAAPPSCRKITITPPLFPAYAFVMIVSGWWNARWSPGVVRLIMDGLLPAHVPDAVISEDPVAGTWRRG